MQGRSHDAANVLRPWVERIKEAERQDAEYGLYIPGDSSLAVVFNAMEESAFAGDFTLAQPSHVSAESPCMDSGYGESPKNEGVEYGYDDRGTADGAATPSERLESSEDRLSPAPRTSAERLVVCPVCRKKVGVTQRGTLRVHRVVGGRCRWSGKAVESDV